LFVPDLPSHAKPAIVFSPPAADWSDLVFAQRDDAAGMAEAETFRRQLGLPTDRLIVMSGHQAGWWHAGILAKYFAMIAAAESLEAAPAWLVVDQDASDSLALRYPVASAGTADTGSTISARTWLLGPQAMAADLRADVAIGSLAPFEPSPLPDDLASLSPSHARALRAMHECTHRARAIAEPDIDLHASPDMLLQEPRPHSAAMQIALANQELLATISSPSQLLPATLLTQTSAFRGLLERMIEDPAGCVEAYNQALAENPVHGVAPLSASPAKSRYELPLWSIGPAGQAPGHAQPRKRIYTTTIGDTPLNHLAPRALLMTAMFRWLGCDLFIHGLGGGASGGGRGEASGGGSSAAAGEADLAAASPASRSGYDRIAEAWFMKWLGVSLAPSVVASATLLLDFGRPSVVQEHDLLQAKFAAHRIKHHPHLAGDDAAQARKQQFLGQLTATTDPAARAVIYRQMHAELAIYRQHHAAALASTKAQAAALAQRFEQEKLLRDRTWPWPLHDRKALLTLKAHITAAFSQQQSARGDS
jgi:hypothetical protein